MPRVGEVFLVPIGDGRAGLCRVLEVRTDPPEVRVLTSAWIGRPDQASAERAREVLRLTHHGQRGKPHVFWTIMPRPRRFVRVGTLAPTAADLALPSHSSAWEYCPLQLAAQSAWDEDADA